MVGARHGAAAGSEQTVESAEPVGLDLTSHGFAVGMQGGRLMSKSLLVFRNTGSGLVERACHGFNMGASVRESGLVRLSSLHAGQLFSLQAIYLGFRKGEFVFQRIRLRRRSDRVALGAQPLSALAMLGNISFQAGANGLFASQSIGAGSGVGLRLVQSRLCLHNFGGERASFLCHPGTLQFDGLKFYQLVNQRIHCGMKSNTRRAIRSLTQAADPSFERPSNRKASRSAHDCGETRGVGHLTGQGPEYLCVDGKYAHGVPARGSGGMGDTSLNMPDKPDKPDEPDMPDSPQPQVRRSFWRRNRWIWWVAGGMAVALIAVTVVLSIVARRFEPFIRERIVASLEQRFHTHVELNYFHISVHHGQEGEWGLWATGRGLRIWPPHREGGDHPLEVAVESKPLIDLGEFSFHVPLRYEMTQHLRIREVRLKNLVIEVPPRSERDKQTGMESAMVSPGGAGRLPDDAPATATPGRFTSLTVDRVICEGADLTLETDKPGKIPLEFEISQLKLMNLAAGRPVDFEAVLTNPRPRGLINTSGSFGPWDVADPGASPVNGKYHFEHADLSVFNGIAGILSSSGNYAGTLREIVVDGESDVPDFRLTSFGNALPVHARFHARVDGTDGDTRLEPVDATLGRSHFTTRGKVVRVLTSTGAPQPVPASTPAGNGAPKKPGAGKPAADQELPMSTPARVGHLIDLKVDIDRGNMEDLMLLVSHSTTPLLLGNVEVTAVLHLPPGDGPVHMRTKLDGSFKLTDARFTTAKIQDRIEELSLRGQGHPDAMKNTDPNSIHSEMEGDFHLDHGVVTLPGLHYGVPGADIELQGYYALDGKLKFEGTARMQATVSQMVGGWKGFLLKPVDRYFRKDGSGTLVPIHLRGSRDAPEFGIDFGRMKQTSPEKPGEKQQ